MHTCDIWAYAYGWETIVKANCMPYLFWVNCICMHSMTERFSRLTQQTPLFCVLNVTHIYSVNFCLFVYTEPFFPGKPRNIDMNIPKAFDSDEWNMLFHTNLYASTNSVPYSILLAVGSNGAHYNENMRIIHSVKLCAPILSNIVWIGLSSFHKLMAVAKRQSTVK